eukprot:gnl/Carplike_NY0171/2408_a3237_574.p1 GENE.gnl/Carplike_NY0171/2408_a3237_574~~gnl/Carplike_NY0171/2408_a3237_574.p1  ORF type:complete len:515 (-),score=119.25 gnl/Carplike_NY0171/2408_a3237_574:307-1851(-)
MTSKTTEMVSSKQKPDISRENVAVESVAKEDSAHIFALGHSPIFPLIVKLSFASVVSFICSTIYEIFDSVFVSKFTSETILGGVSAFLYFEYLVSLQVGVSMASGASSISSHALGENKLMRAQKCVMYIFVFGCIFAVIVPIVVIPLLPYILPALGVDDIVYDETRRYATAVVIGSGFSYFGVAFSIMLRAENLPLLSMLIQVVPSLLNIAGDVIFMKVFDMGALGAGISTVISNLVGTIIGFFLYLHPKSKVTVRLTKEVFKAPSDKETMKKMMSLSIPNYIFGIGFSLGGILASKNIANYTESGEERMMWIAAYGSSNRLGNLVWLPSQGIALSVPTILGYNIGASRFKRCWETIWKAFIMVLVFSWILCSIILIWARPIATLFADSDEMIDILSEMSRITIYPVLGLSLMTTVFTIYMAERSIGFQVTIAVMSWVLTIAPVYILPKLFDSVEGFKYVMCTFYGLNLSVCLVFVPIKLRKYFKLAKEEDATIVISMEDSESDKDSKPMVSSV